MKHPGPIQMFPRKPGRKPSGLVEKPAAKRSGKCVECGEPHKRHHLTMRCQVCMALMQAVSLPAISAVHRAIKTGALVPAKTLICVDCGKPATDYDHRDYRRPLDVVPTCRSCNQKRGPALWREPEREVA